MPMGLLSRSTFFYKQVLPYLLFGFCAIFVLVGLTAGGPGGLFFVLFGVVMALVYLMYLRHLVWPLADHVYDRGEFLLFRKDEHEQRVMLHDIADIRYALTPLPQRLVVVTHEPGPLGHYLSFIPMGSIDLHLYPLMHVDPPAFVDGLVERINRAREARP